MIVLVRKETPKVPPTPILPQPQSPLLSLPAELRLQIWEMLLIHHPQNTTSSSSSSTPPPPTSKFAPAPLLRTSKQINSETTPILYSHNTFLADSTLLSSLPSFLLKIHPSRQTLPPVLSPHLTSQIKHYFIHVRLDVDPRFSALQAKESFTGVESLEIEVFQSMYGSCDFTNLRRFERVRGVGKVVVGGSIGDGRYARFLEGLMMRRGEEEEEESENEGGGSGFEEAWVGGSESWGAWRERHAASSR